MSSQGSGQSGTSWVWRILGLPFRVLHWVTRTRYRVLAAILVVFGLMVGASFEAYHYWSSPGFCINCHYMDPYYASWKKSKHNEVRCVECHFEPGIGAELHGKWVAVKQLVTTITGAYSSMPYAEVSDASCMREGCHTSKELEKETRTADESIGFTHGKHLSELPRGIRLACTSCHAQRVNDVHLAVDRSTCFLCHFRKADPIEGKDLGDCTTCHEAPTKKVEVDGIAFDHREVDARGMQCTQCHSELVSGSGAVRRERCYSCHNEVEKIKKIDNAGVMHVEHVTKGKLHCYECHDLISHRLPEKGHKSLPAKDEGNEPIDACASCHQDLHGPQALLFHGRGAKGLPSRPDKMATLGLDCVACHANTDAASCRDCHGTDYDPFLKASTSALKEMLSFLELRTKKVEVKIASLESKGGSVDAELYRSIRAVSANLALLKAANPVHNPLYSVEILRSAHVALTDAEESLELEEPDEQPDGLEDDECFVCHDHLPMPGKLDVGGKRIYDHPLHVEKSEMDCADCHLEGRHPRRAATSEQSCALCHKDDGKGKRK